MSLGLKYSSQIKYPNPPTTTTNKIVSQYLLFIQYLYSFPKGLASLAPKSTYLDHYPTTPTFPVNPLDRLAMSNKIIRVKFFNMRCRSFRHRMLKLFEPKFTR